MSIVTWMTYALTVSVLVGIAAGLLEHGLSRVGVPTRWVWLGALLLSLGLPGVGPLRVREGTTLRAPVEDAWLGAQGPRDMDEPASGALGGLDSLVGFIARCKGALDRAVFSASASLAESPTVERLAGALWGATSLLLAVVLLASGLRLARHATRWPRETWLGREVRVSPDLGPATLGLFHPDIVIPPWVQALPTPELEMVLTHEEEHQRSKDPLLLALGLMASIAFPWNPLVWWQRSRLADAIEMDCDRRVLRRGAVASQYGDLLIRLRGRGRSVSLPMPTMSSSPSLLERRLNAMKRKMRLRSALPGTSAATVSAFGLVLLACGTEPPVGTQDGAALGAVGQDETLDIWVQRDGSVFVNDELRSMEEVSDVVGPPFAASDGALVISIAGDSEVPYRVMRQLEQELEAVGVARVLFRPVNSPALRSPLDETDAASEGLAIVLPQRGEPVQVSQRDVLRLVVQPSGVVDVSRGADSPVRHVRPGDVEGLWREEAAANPNLIASVRTASEAAYTHTLDVLDALHAARAERISLGMLEN